MTGRHPPLPPKTRQSRKSDRAVNWTHPTPTWLAADTQGSEDIAIDGSTGAAARQRYLPYGAHRGGSDAITATDRGYLGRTEDTTTGLDQLGARYYDPAIGRFISTDPIQNLADPQQRNPYAYAADNPTTLSDPDGLQVDCPTGAGGCGNTGNLGGGTGKGDPDYSPTGHNCAAFNGKCKGVGAKYQERRKRQVVACYMNPRCSPGSGPDGVPGTVEDGLDLYGAGHWGFNKRSTKDKWRSMVNMAVLAVTVAYGGPEDIAAVGGVKIIAKVFRLAFKGGKVAPRIRTAIKAGGKVGCPAGNSFTLDTKVLLADGKHKSISKIKLGDKILATDPVTGKTKPEPVVALIAGQGAKHLTTITIHTDGGKGHHTATITATDQHPFWTITTRPGHKPSGHWTNATDLHAGTRLRTPTGHVATIIATRRFVEPQAVNNLTIARLHTYYVEAGTTSVLVHNCGLGLRAPEEAGISPSEARQIQNAANRTKQRITVVGSRANGSAGEDSDWDYILSGPSRARGSAKFSLPRGVGGDWQGRRFGIDIFQNYNPEAPNYATLDPDLPHVIFDPEVP